MVLAHDEIALQQQINGLIQLQNLRAAAVFGVAQLVPLLFEHVFALALLEEAEGLRHDELVVRVHQLIEHARLGIGRVVLEVDALRVAGRDGVADGDGFMAGHDPGRAKVLIQRRSRHPDFLPVATEQKIEKLQLFRTADAMFIVVDFEHVNAVVGVRTVAVKARFDAQGDLIQRTDCSALVVQNLSGGTPRRLQQRPFDASRVRPVDDGQVKLVGHHPIALERVEILRIELPAEIVLEMRLEPVGLASAYGMRPDRDVFIADGSPQGVELVLAAQHFVGVGRLERDAGNAPGADVVALPRHDGVIRDVTGKRDEGRDSTLAIKLRGVPRFRQCRHSSVSGHFRFVN